MGMPESPRDIQTIGLGNANEENLEDIIIKIPKDRPATIFVIHASWGQLEGIAKWALRQINRKIVRGVAILLVLILVLVFVGHILGISCAPNELIPGLWNGECYDGNRMAGM